VASWGEISVVGPIVDIELAAHHSGGARDDASDDVGVGHASDRIGDGVIAVTEGGKGRVERLVRPRVDDIGPDKIQPGIENAHVNVAVQVNVEPVDEGDRDVAVGQDRDRRRKLVFRDGWTEVDLAADLVARGIVSLADNGRAVGVIGPALVRPDDDVTAIRQSRDVAIELRCKAVRGDRRVRRVDLRQGFHEARGSGHGVLRTRLSLAR